MADKATRYEIRRAALAELGYATYQDYLDSPRWKHIRAAILKRDKGRCVMCPQPAASVHHITYATAVMAGRDWTQLVSVCRGCHKQIEFDQDVKLISTKEIFDRLLNRTGKKRSRKSANKLQRKISPRCRCCGKQSKAVGRNDICLPCYRSGRALKWLQTHSP